MTARIVFVPGTLALLPEYASRTDPIAELRSACDVAVTWLLEVRPTDVTVLGDPLAADGAARGLVAAPAQRIARALLDRGGFEGRIRHVLDPAGLDAARALLVVANGSARRSTAAPGYFDESALAFDAEVERALLKGDAAALAHVDADRGAALLAAGTRALAQVGRAMTGPVVARCLHRADPFGVQYWVVTWDVE